MYVTCVNVAETTIFSAAYIKTNLTCIASYKTNMLSSFIHENKKLDSCVLVALYWDLNQWMAPLQVPSLFTVKMSEGTITMKEIVTMD